MKRKQYIYLGIEPRVTNVFNKMVRKSKLNKSDFLEVLINIFNEHDIRSRTLVVSRRTSEDGKDPEEGSGTPIPLTKDTGGRRYKTPSELYETPMETTEAETEAD